MEGADPVPALNASEVLNGSGCYYDPLPAPAAPDPVTWDNTRDGQPSHVWDSAKNGQPHAAPVITCVCGHAPAQHFEGRRCQDVKVVNRQGLIVDVQCLCEQHVASPPAAERDAAPLPPTVAGGSALQTCPSCEALHVAGFPTCDCSAVGTGSPHTREVRETAAGELRCTSTQCDRPFGHRGSHTDVAVAAAKRKRAADDLDSASLAVLHAREWSELPAQMVSVFDRLGLPLLRQVKDLLAPPVAYIVERCRKLALSQTLERLDQLEMRLRRSEDQAAVPRPVSEAPEPHSHRVVALDVDTLSSGDPLRIADALLPDGQTKDRVLWICKALDELLTLDGRKYMVRDAVRERFAELLLALAAPHVSQGNG